MVYLLGFLATPGGLNAAGCHNDRKGGTGYHCHRSSTRQPLAETRRNLSESTNFRNCAAARAAGAAPVRAGDPGYSRRLDRDGDGVGCE
ncbi:excalibur calcium-binding domain-containing protein [Sphingomonas sp. Leaf67]|uniref:excalibur calcium-binding domain-containing protein n=1 Tax=Sphingomonas sp. Leaf67 TaxID=1736230 RepID=UPI001F30EFCC|nr:excalibur calcium-binding domain-containing protein [Sphingomonas sp. Leaf67]